MLVKIFLRYIGSDSNLGHFIGNIDVLLMTIALVCAVVVYFITDFKDFDCLERDEQYKSSRRFSQVRISEFNEMNVLFFDRILFDRTCVAHVCTGLVRCIDLVLWICSMWFYPNDHEHIRNV